MSLIHNNFYLLQKDLKSEIKKFENDTVLKQKRERWHEDLAKDVYMDEAINVLEDLKVNNIRLTFYFTGRISKNLVNHTNT